MRTRTIILGLLLGAFVNNSFAQTAEGDSTQTISAQQQTDSIQNEEAAPLPQTPTTPATSLPDQASATIGQESQDAMEDTTKSSGDNSPHYLLIFEKAYYKLKESKFAEFIGENHWGAFGGFGPANVHFDKYDLYQHAVCNVRLGIIADHNMDMIKKDLFVETGIELQRKGYQRFFDEHADSLHVSYMEKTNLYYLVIPTTVSHRFFFRGFEFTPMLGPYYAIALGGRFRNKRETHDGGQYIMQTKKYSMFGDKTGTDRLYDTRRFDFGLRIAVGIQYFENMRSSMGYDWGFIDIIKSDFRGDKYKSTNGVFYLSHTYFFH